MPELVRVDTTNEIIIIVSRDNVTEADLFESLEKVCEYSETYGYKKILIDALEQAELPGVGGLYQFAKLMSSKTVGVKQAIVTSDSTPLDIRFIETVAHNHGAHIARFTTIDDAVKWLNQ